MGLFKRKHNINRYGKEVYELKVGGVYLIEYQAQIVGQRTISALSSALQSKGIDVLFVPNPTNSRIFEPVPANPKEEEQPND